MGLKDKLTLEMKNAWMNLFIEITNCMVSDHYRPSSGPTLDLGEESLKEIRSSWEQAKQLGLDTVGVLLMRNIFTIEPNAL